jgi:hypothetical protein
MKRLHTAAMAVLFAAARSLINTAAVVLGAALVSRGAEPGGGVPLPTGFRDWWC